MTSTFSRYAVYAIPDPASPLFQRASRWLGWDSVAAVETLFPGPDELGNPASLDIERLTRTPRKYGFHGTLKPPMRLAEGRDEAALIARTADLAATLTPVAIPTLDIAVIGRFLALVPTTANPALSDLAAAIVTGLDEFRRPADDAELATRRANGLSTRQDELLCEWGYPYVLDEFRFHMTLSGQQSTDEIPAVQAMLTEWIGPHIPATLMLDRLVIMGETESGRFQMMASLPIGGRAQGKGLRVP